MIKLRKVVILAVRVRMRTYIKASCERHIKRRLCKKCGA